LGIAVLLIPVIWLGNPAGELDKVTKKPVGGGKLAQLRQEYELGDTSLGDVDPASSTMTLVLLGFRGIAANMLWMEAIEHQKLKNWAQLRANVDSIILLQPHFLSVWDFQGWNLAYNVSAQWDAVPDRYYWVKEGAKFEMKGASRNSRFPECYWWTGRILGHKIGRSDEWRYFRQFFRVDPNREEFEDGPDPEMSIFEGREFYDNYLAAKYWYQTANLRDELHEQNIQEPLIFREHPAKSQLDYAEALQREGKFGEITREAWATANRNWTTKYDENGKDGFGLEHFLVLPVGGYVFLEADTDEEIKELIVDRDNAEYNEDSIAGKWRAIDQFQNIVNYRYWRTRSQAESDGITEKAHRDLYEGKQLFKAARNSEAKERLLSGMQDFETLLGKYPVLLTDSITIEECLMAFLYLQSIYQLEQIPMPKDLPLRRENPQPGFPAQNLVQQHKTGLPSLIKRFKHEISGL
ncbi:MAG: hypothetical protein IH899_01615, partial [Planctomycetes bacterium]|nr:hypothetical protein [Planctomycetota bacterium]